MAASSMFPRRSMLCVCTGNICRSPLAAGYLNHRLADWTIRSAGIAALVGSPADDHALAIARRDGLDLTAHRARQIDHEQIEACDLVLAMSAGQLDWIQQAYPFARGRVYLVSQWTTQSDIQDPHRGSRALFEAVYARICADLDPWLAKLGPRAT